MYTSYIVYDTPVIYMYKLTVFNLTHNIVVNTKLIAIQFSSFGTE